jgi:hypothetical protein
MNKQISGACLKATQLGNKKFPKFLSDDDPRKKTHEDRFFVMTEKEI